jgi:predicted esterase
MQPNQICLIHGTADDTVPIESSRELALKFSGMIEYLDVAEGDHPLNQALFSASDLLIKGGAIERMNVAV